MLRFLGRQPKTGTRTIRDTASSSGEGVAELLRQIQTEGNGGLTPIPILRRVRRNPVVAIARMAAHAPVKASGPISFALEGEEDTVELCERYLGPVWEGFLRSALFAMDYGYTAGEIVWARKAGVFAPDRVKPLLPEKVQPIIDQTTGDVGGIKWDGKVSLGEGEFLWLSYGGEGENPFGEGRLESCVEVWRTWRATTDRMGRYLSKVAGVIPMIEYPEGKGFDANGSEQDNFELAKKVLQTLSSGEGVIMPNVLAKYAEDFAARGMTPSDLRAWNIGFIETKGQHGADFEAALRTLDRYLVRGYLTPERSITEGTHGTKADAEVQSEFVIHEGEDFIKLAAKVFHRGLVVPFVRYNVGPTAAERIETNPPTILDETRSFIRGSISQILSQPATLQMLLDTIDLDTMLTQSDIPLREGRSTEDSAAFVDPEPTDPGEADPVANLSRMYANLYRRA